MSHHGLGYHHINLARCRDRSHVLRTSRRARCECRVSSLRAIVISRVSHRVRSYAFCYRNRCPSARMVITIVGLAPLICPLRHSEISMCDAYVSQKSGDIIFPQVSLPSNWVSHVQKEVKRIKERGKLRDSL